MIKRIFRAICAAALSVFLVTMLLIFGVLYSYFFSVQQNQLRAETALAVQGIEQLGSAYFHNLSVSGYRITWIAANGSVLYDSSSDFEAMENHLEREEIQEALKTGYGESSRYSATLMQRSLYCAQRLTDGTVLRLCTAHSSVLSLFIGMLRPILAIIAVAAVLSFALANRLSKRIVEPMNQLNLDSPLENEGYDELAPLLRRIYSQQQQLRLQKAHLLQKQNQLDAIVGNMEEGMVLLDNGGNILSVNRAALQLLDAPGAQFGESLLSVSRNMELQQAVQRASAGTAAAVQTKLHSKDIQISAAPVQAESGISGVAVVLFDITQQQQAEQRRREFTANISHELKTPLQSISGFSELMKLGIAKPEDVPHFAENIYSEAQRLISLVEDIINLSHLDEGGEGLQWAELDLYAQAQQVLQRLDKVAAQREVSLLLKGGPAFIWGVPELVCDIVYNLCDNAIKYNRRGGSVTVQTEQTESAALLTVEDTGIGIPPEHLDRIFERFYRVDKSRSKEVGGTGLGLSIVKHAALIHQAQVEVTSTPGQGTKATVKFKRGRQ